LIYHQSLALKQYDVRIYVISAKTFRPYHTENSVLVD